MKISLTILIVTLLFYIDSYSQNTIIFSEDFEILNKQELLKKWVEISNLSGMNLSNEKPPSSTGSKSLMITYNPDRNNGGHLFKTFDKDYNQLFVRFYCKFSGNHSPLNQFVKLGGYNPLTQFSQKDFNQLPNGDDRFSAGPIVRSDFGFWDLNVNWMNMKINPDTIVLPNHFNPNPPSSAITNKWYCVEFMIKLNEPANSSNGELALWIDGRKIIHLGQGFPNGYWEKENFFPSTDNSSFEGFQWRKDDNLKINYLWLLYYLTNGTSGKRDTVWFDDIVVATNYIGPIGGSDINPTQESSEKKIIFNHKTMSIELNVLEPDESINEIYIFDLLGKKVIDLNFPLADGFPISGIPLSQYNMNRGLYYLILKTTKRTYSTKILIFPG
jgi:hypothetical protein